MRLGYTEDDIKKLASMNNLELINIYYISECNNYRAKHIFKINNGLFCYFFNILYLLKVFNYKRYIKSEDAIDKLNYFSISAIFKNKN